jgi:hypothetical protein
MLNSAKPNITNAATRCHEVSNDVVLGEALAINDALDIVDKLGAEVTMFVTRKGGLDCDLLKFCCNTNKC